MKPAKIAMFAVLALCLLMFFRGKVSGFSLRDSADAAIDMGMTAGPVTKVLESVVDANPCARTKCKGPGQTAKSVTNSKGVTKCQCS